jgi:hypothetical protein
MKYLRSKRGLAAFGALAAVVGATLFVVLPALASNAGDQVPPASSPGNVTPVDVSVGGNGNCSNLFPGVGHLPALSEYDNPNPQNGTNLPSYNGDGVTFSLSLSGNNKQQRLHISSSPAVAIAGLGINGGTDSTVYDYTGLDYAPGVAQKWVASDGNLHAPAAKYSVNGVVENPSQWYGISHLTVCYRLLAPISGVVFEDANGTGSPTGQSGIGNVAVSIVDTVTGETTTVQTAGGTGSFSVSQPVGDSYTVCAASPGSNYTQTAPTSGHSCPGGLTGYSLTLGSGGSSTSNFGFQSYSTISGKVYEDANESGSYDSGDSAQAWTVNLYQGSNTTPVATTTSNTDGNGLYTLKAPLTPQVHYTVCEIPAGSGTWAQGIPSPKSDDLCSGFNGAGALPKGYTVTGTSNIQTITGDDFANVAAETCPADKNANGVDYSVSLDCEKEGQTYVSTAGLLPNGKPYVRLWAGDQTLGNPAPLIEKITWPYTSVAQNAITVLYTDLYPFLTSNLHAMRLCQRDPTSDVTAWHPGLPLPAGVLQDPTDSSGVDPESTSCLISVSTTVSRTGDTEYVALVYSAVDGFRTSG